MLRSIISILLISACSFSHAQTYTDVEGSADHPLFPKRIAGFYISNFEKNDNDKASFSLGTKPDAFIQNVVKGKKTVIVYALKYGTKKPSKLLVRKIYTNAAKAAGASVLFDGDGKEKHSEDDGGLYITDQATMVFVKDGKETWASISFLDEHAEAEMAYQITIIEPIEVPKNAAFSSALLDELNKTGRIELYINFDRGKDIIKPEGEVFVNEIAKLLIGNPSINLSIEGHTDNVGDPNQNQILSEKRAKSVYNALIKLGIKSDRISSVGKGAADPIASNTTEEGKSLNRRVELVKK